MAFDSAYGVYTWRDENLKADNRLGFHILPTPTCHENPAWQRDICPCLASTDQSYYWFSGSEENHTPEETRLSFTQFEEFGFQRTVFQLCAPLPDTP